MSALRVPCPGDVWEGRQEATRGRVICVVGESDDGYVAYTVIRGKDGIGAPRASGRMRSISLRHNYGWLGQLHEEDEEKGNVMPDQVTVSRDELLEVLRRNRAAHREAFVKAQELYRERAIAELDRALADARAGNGIRLSISMPVPEDHTDDYDREIRMLEMSVHERVTLASHLFDQVVMDRWRWSASWESNTMSYLS